VTHIANFSNLILAQLPAGERQALSQHLEPIDLPMGFCIAEAGHDIKHVYFLETGLGSIVVVSRTGKKVEAGMFGAEGFAPCSPAVGIGFSLYEVVIQSPGSAHRLSVEVLWTIMDVCPSFTALLQRASHNLSTQVSYTAQSNALHKIGLRLARWLLMCHDRLGQEIVITHDYIALMLAVRRPSVTEALQVLEGEGYIRSERKLITIRNRPALEAFASDAYGVPEEEYKRVVCVKPVKKPEHHPCPVNEPLH
jgi:CRP-like cAMP-binding protein